MSIEEKEFMERKRPDRERILLGLINRARLGIVIIDQSHRVIEANTRFCEMLGYSAGEITGLHTWDWDAVMTEEQIREQFADLSNIDFTFETKHRRKGGSIYDVEISSTGMSLGKGKSNAVICICQDISAKKRTEAELARSEKRFRNYVENAADVIFTLGPDAAIKYISPNFLKVHGFEQREVEGVSVFSFVHPEDLKPFKALIKKAFSQGSEKFSELRFIHKDGTCHWYSLSFSRLEEDGEPVLICNARNIDVNKAYEEKLKFMSLYDQLTGVPNRAYLNQEMNKQDKSDYPISLLICDFDGLKAVNDRYGHAAGDMIITVTSGLIQSALRDGDFLARLGGDEFAILLKATAKEEALKVIEKIRENFNNYNSKENGIQISISIGLATAEDASNSLSQLMNKADKDMYAQKSDLKRQYL